jgi:hypothetical protein
MFDITQFRADILTPTLGALQFREIELKELLVFTCAVESAGGTYVRQIKGPALGIFQMEPNTFTDIWHNFILRKPDIVNLFSLNLGVHRLPDPTEMITDLKLATAMAACLYKQRKASILSCKEDDLWDVYKPLYNTDKGAAKKFESINAYRKFIGEKPLVKA